MSIKAHKICLNPDNIQKTYFAQAAGVARFAYNWALHEWSRQYKETILDPNKLKPSEGSLRRQLNAIKKESFPWMLKVTKNAPQMAIINLGKAFKNFFAGRAKYPRFQKKGVRDSFTLTNDQFEVNGSQIRIPHLGWVRMHESLRFAGKILSATISKKGERWFVSISVEIIANMTENSKLTLPKTENQGMVGVDLGVKRLATFSTGEVIIGPKPHKILLKRLKYLSRSLSRKRLNSKNRLKARKKLGKLHFRIANIRQDALHKLTTYLAKNFHTIGIEDLNIKGMLANRKLSRAIADMGFYEFRRLLEYKSYERGGLIIIADRWFASTKICSICKFKVEKLSLSVRQWCCAVCNTEHDRDLNAAINLKDFAVSSTVIACGEEGSGLKNKLKVKPASVKQESNSKLLLSRFG